MRKKRSIIWQINKMELNHIVKNSETISDILKHFGLKNIGGNYKTLKLRLNEDSVDYSHIPLGIRSNRNRFRGRSNAIPLEKVLIKNSTYSRWNLKKRLIKANLLINQCAVCKLPPEWNGQPLPLELDHINGVNDDNRIENLRLICPNCHAQTNTNAGKNIKHRKPKMKICIGCSGLKRNNTLPLCQSCVNVRRRQKSNRPPKEELQKLLWIKPTTAIAYDFNVSDKAVEKWAKSYGLPKPPRGYWAKQPASLTQLVE